MRRGVEAQPDTADPDPTGPVQRPRAAGHGMASPEREEMPESPRSSQFLALGKLMEKNGENPMEKAGFYISFAICRCFCFLVSSSYCFTIFMKWVVDDQLLVDGRQ